MGKYFKYAIGEIILVVIGILLAVQINSYFNEKKARSDNKIFLNKMIDELELNKKRMEMLINKEDNNKDWTNYKTALANCDSLLRLSYKGFKVEDIPKLLTMKITTGGSSLNTHSSTYEELLNTGQLYSLGSDSLTSAVKDYYKMLAREEKYNEANNQEVLEAFDLLDGNVGEIYREFEYNKAGFALENYPWLFNKNSAEYKTFQLALTKILRSETYNLNKMEAIIVSSDELIASINKELRLAYD